MRRDPGFWMVLFGGGIVGALLLSALLAPWLTPADPQGMDLELALRAPCLAHPMGTDSLGRDLFCRMLYGARISLAVGFIAVGVATVIGVVAGVVAGTLGGLVDHLQMRGVDVMLCFPSIFLILAAVAFLGPSLFNLIAIIGGTSWMGVTRLVRAEVLSLKEREFILAARGMGASTLRIILRHLLPNALAPVIVSATLGIGSAILTESGLSFLGIGIQPPVPSWGNILSEGKNTLGVAWWLTFFPGSAIFLVVLGCNMIGEGLRSRGRA